MVRSATEQRVGSWLGYSAQMRLPDMRGDFAANRDPYIAVQIVDMDKTESERRSSLMRAAHTGQTESEQSGDSGGQSSAPVKGLQAQRDAAFERYEAYKRNLVSQEPDRSLHRKPYQAPRYSGPSM